MHKDDEINSKKSTLHALHSTIISDSNTKTSASYISKFAVYQILILNVL